MRRPSRTGLSWVFVLCANIPLIAQNLEAIGKEKPFSFSGGLSLNQVFYNARGITARRDPFTYYASGNINLTLYGWSVPLAFSLAKGNAKFSQPFNQYSLHPTWKWITLHAGYTAMNFSPYTVNGHAFTGCSIDLAPGGKWTFSALYGRFLKAVEVDSTHGAQQPTFQRFGYAAKAAFQIPAFTLDLILFHARDEPTSISSRTKMHGITPQENFVVSVAASKTLFKYFVWKAELASSAVTKDTWAPRSTHDHVLAKSGALFRSRLSSSYHQAMKTSLDYQHEGWVVGLGYERIDPEYRTLGAYYFNNDLENITLNASANLSGGKINIALSGGLQHDNVDKTKVSTMRRLVNSLNLTYTPSQQLSLSGSWSTFQTFTNIRSQFESVTQLTPYENLDTLNFTQLSRNGSFSGTYSLRNTDTKKQNLSVSFAFQDAADRQGSDHQHSSTRFYNIHTGYSISFPPLNMSVVIAFNSTIQRAPLIDTRMVGPNAAITRAFFQRKLRLSVASSWNKTYSQGTAMNSLINGRVNAALSIRDNHKLNLAAVVVKRSMMESRSRSVTEFTATAGYSYNITSRK